MSTVMDIYNPLPPYAKAVVIIGGSAIAWFAIINPVRKLIVQKLDQSKFQREGTEAKQSLQDLSKKGIKATITDAQAESFANSLVKAFSGCGTDEAAVYGVASQLKNDADVYKLISTYGVRKYDNCFWLGGGEENSSLSAAISDELDGMEKSILNSILKKNGVTYQFT